MQDFFACGNSAPLRVECESAEAALHAGTLAGAKCAGTWTASAPGVMALS